MEQSLSVKPLQTETDETYSRLLVDGVPLIDVRAPVEFAAGAVPGAVNLPLLTDDERHRVGLCYRQQGSDAAHALGHRLLRGQRREEALAAWLDHLEKFPAARLYCARGGSRSAIAAQWLEAATGRLPPRLAGGYKAFRTFLLGRLDPAAIDAVPIVLGGRTGSGKTLLLRRLANAIDLEALANHRGSSFGQFLTVQPGQADFENRLAAALAIHRFNRYATLVVEDEGRHIGKRFLPKELADMFAGGALIVLEAPLAERIDTISAEYVDEAQAVYRSSFGDEAGLVRWLADMEASADRLAKRLGAARLVRVKQLLNRAWQRQRTNGDHHGHRDWIKILLQEYYDPMYDYQIDKKKERVVFRGGADEVLSYLREREETGRATGRAAPAGRS
ncbi:MAG: tRNA 2-selenouridine(34) synthase MnmH [Desulfofustis sp.]|jgi:tRNA 2-selenouridine synthase|nr:tRNA 2-selenouridine(34) synthase MnmH [Desulfofustis sp.]